MGTHAKTTPTADTADTAVRADTEVRADAAADTPARADTPAGTRVAPGPDAVPELTDQPAELVSHHCNNCHRHFSTGLTHTLPLCPPCWLESVPPPADEPPLPSYFQPDTWEEHLTEQWLSYFDLLRQALSLPGQRGGLSFTQMTQPEQLWFAVAELDSYLNELGFAHYFKRWFNTPLDSLITVGFSRLEAIAQLGYYKQARAVFVELSPPQLEEVVHPDYPPLEGPFGLLDHQYFDLGGLSETIARAAFADGLLKSPQVPR